MNFNTWQLVPRPANVNVIPVHWVLTKKKDAKGHIVKFKARLVAQGNYQQHGLDFTDTYAPVANQQALRILLTLAVYMDYDLFHIDVDNAFLNGSVDRLIYIRQPPHFVDPSLPHCVCRLNKAIYGLKQAALCWWKDVDNTLKSIGFHKCVGLQGMYYKSVNDKIAYILLYVDDILIACPSTAIYYQIRDSLAKHYSIKDLGPVRKFLKYQHSEKS